MKQNNKSVRNIFFWRILIVSVLVLLLVNIVSLAAYTYVGRNAFTNMETENLASEAGLTLQIYQDYSEGKIDRETFSELIEKQSAALNSAVLISNELGRLLIVRDNGFEADTSELNAYFDSIKQQVLHGETVTIDSIVIAGSELAVGVGVPVVSEEGTVSGSIFIVKQVERIRTAFQPLSDTLLIAVLIILPIVMLILVFSSNTITKPLVNMANVATEMSKGNFDIRADDSMDGEIGALAGALNTLCENLSGTIYQLRNEKIELNQILSSFSDGVAAIDRLGCLTHYNPALKEMFGTIDISSPIDLVPDQGIWDEFQKVTESLEMKTLQYTLPGNRSLWISIVPILSEDKTCLGAVGLFKDVTEFERLEQTRRDYVANVSHELRTPITAVRGLLEPLADGMVKDEETRQKYYNIMLHEVVRLSKLITDLLQLSRLQSGTEYMDLGPVDVGELLEEMQMNYKSEASKRHISLNLDTEDIPLAMTDGDRIEQVLVILIDNAMRYTPEGGSITLSAVSGEKIMVSVTDTGCGIAAEELPHLFERFYKVDKARKDGGTGLGLSIAKQIMDKLGEKISVESTVGKGTSFHFTLQKYVKNAIALGPTSGEQIIEINSRDVEEKTDSLTETNPDNAPYEVIAPKKKKEKKPRIKRK